MSKKPPSLEGFPDKFTAEKSREFYQHYRENGPKKRFTRFALKAAGVILKPTVIHRDAEGVRKHLENGGVFVATGNHTSGLDPFGFAAAVGSDETLSPIEQPEPRTRILAKISLFKNKALRWMIEAVGAVPVGRAYESDTEGGKSAREEVISFGQDSVADGAHIVLFSQDKRGPVFERSEAKKGAAKIAVGAVEQMQDRPQDEQIPVAVLPFGIGYEGEIPEFSFSREILMHPIDTFKTAIDYVRFARSATLTIGSPILVENGQSVNDDPVIYLHDLTMSGIEEALQQEAA